MSSFILAGILSLPFGMKTVKKNINRFPAFWISFVAAVTQMIVKGDYIVTIEPGDIANEDPDSTLSQIALGFKIATGKMPSNKPSRELIISNHQIYADWIYLWSFLNHFGRGNAIKIVMKRVFQFVPIFGWGMKALDFIFIHRNWALDRLKFYRRIRRIADYGLPYNLLIFPEGTTMNPEAFVKSGRFAEDNGLTALKHCLLPRVTGLEAAVTALRGGDNGLEGVLDLTVGFSGLTPDIVPEEFYGLRSIYLDAHAPKQIHIHCSYIPIDHIPSEHEAFSAWVVDRFKIKDELMKGFYANGKFPGISSKPVPLASRRSCAYLVGGVLISHTILALAVALSLGKWQ